MGKYKGKYDINWEFEFPTFTKGDSDYHAYCIACRKDVSIGYGGKGTLRHHAKQPCHQRNVRMNVTTSIGIEIERNKEKLRKLAQESGINIDVGVNLTKPNKNVRIIVVNDPNKAHFHCPLCHADHASRDTLNEHLYSFHKQKDVIVRRNFSTLQDFYEWKKATEEQTNSHFIATAKPINKVFYIQYFSCDKNNQVNQPKESSVLSFCPSEIKLTVDTEKNLICVNYRPNHLGHELLDGTAPMETVNNQKEVIDVDDNDEDDVGADQDLPLDVESDQDDNEYMTEANITLEKSHVSQISIPQATIPQPKFDPAKSKAELINYFSQLLDEYSDQGSHEMLKDILDKFESDKIAKSEDDIS